MSLFKKYISIIQEGYSDSEKRTILNSYKKPDVFCYLINQEKYIIEEISYDYAKKQKLGDLLNKLKSNSNIDDDTKKNIANFNKNKTDISIMNLFKINKESLKKFQEKIIEDVSLGKIITGFFSGDPIEFISNYRLITPEKYVKLYKDDILKRLESESSAKKQENKKEVKKIEASINDKFLSVIKDKLKFSEDKISSIMSQNKISPIRARTMSIGYFLDEVNSNPFNGYNVDKKEDIIVISKKEYDDKESLEYNAIQIAGISKDKLKEVVDNAFSSSYNSDDGSEMYNKDEIMKMEYGMFKDIFQDNAPFYGLED